MIVVQYVGSNEEISVNDQLDVRIIKRLVLYLYTNDGNVSKISRQFLGASSEEKDRFIEILESMGKDIQ